jgi:hypothetical protein
MANRRAVQIFPERGWIKKQKLKLRGRFQPHPLVRIDSDSVDGRTIDRLRQLNHGQLDHLLKALGLDRTTPNVWERAFFLLAVIHYGVGHITWTPPRGPNRRNHKWTVALDTELYNDVRALTEGGCTETQALEKIAKDAKKCAKFQLRTDSRSETPDRKRHFQTLKKRLRHIKRTPFALRRAIGDTDDVTGWLAAQNEIPQLQLGEIKVSEKSNS